MRYGDRETEDGPIAVYAVAQGRIQDRSMLEQYIARAVSSVEPHGGRIIAYDEEPLVVEGKIENPRTVIVEFPTMSAFQSWYNSPEYQAILPLRLKSAPGTLIVAAGT